MRYLFVGGSMFDRGGLAMIQGAINGIAQLDTESEFCAHVIKGEEDRHKQCRMLPDAMKAIFLWADVVLDVGGRCHDSLARRKQVMWARMAGKPFVWMAQSFTPGMNDGKFFDDTIPVARGERSADIVERLTGRRPVVAADLSFLTQPSWIAPKYDRVFTTHFRRPVADMKKYIEGACVQLVWKNDKLRRHEPQLDMPQLHGDADYLFGVVASAKAVYTARYQAGCAAILAGKPLKLLGADMGHDKYADLLGLRGWGVAELQAAAMLSCKIAVGARKEEPWKSRKR